MGIYEKLYKKRQAKTQGKFNPRHSTRIVSLYLYEMRLPCLN